MSAQPVNPWKLGLFVVATVLTGVVALFWVGVQRFNRAVVEHVTYFDESVQGLDIGAPVKMRGVTIGQVEDITIAPDQRLVQVSADVFVDTWVRLGLGSEEELRSSTFALPDDLRVQLATTGITGEKFLQVDFFPTAERPALSFVPPPSYIPSTPSTLKSLGEAATVLADRLPETLRRFDSLAVTLEDEVRRVAGALESAAGTFEAAASEAQLGATTGSLRGTSEAYRGLALEAGALTAEARETLVRLRAFLAAFEALARLLERQPGALLRGHATEFGPSTTRTPR